MQLADAHGKGMKFKDRNTIGTQKRRKNDVNFRSEIWKKIESGASVSIVGFGCMFKCATVSLRMCAYLCVCVWEKREKERVCVWDMRVCERGRERRRESNRIRHANQAHQAQARAKNAGKRYKLEKRQIQERQEQIETHLQEKNGREMRNRNENEGRQTKK